MDKLERILDLTNEIETSLLEAVLKDKDIPHVIKSNHDTAYNGLVQMQSGWGYLEAPASYRKQILDIYKDLISNRAKMKLEKTADVGTVEALPPVTRQEPALKRSRLSIAAVIGILLLILVMWYLIIDNSNLAVRLSSLERRALDTQNIEFQWSDVENTDLGYFKGSQIVARRFIDNDADGTYDAVGFYSRYGRLVGEKRDADTNGHFETSLQYDQAGEKTVETIENEKTRMREKETWFLDDGETALWIDVTGNGQWDRVEVYRRDGTVEKMDVGQDVLGNGEF